MPKKLPPQDIASILDYCVDFDDAVPAGDSLSSAAWSDATGDLTISASVETANESKANISGGSAGQTYIINVAGTTSNGLVLTQSFMIPFIDKNYNAT